MTHKSIPTSVSFLHDRSLACSKSDGNVPPLFPLAALKSELHTWYCVIKNLAFLREFLLQPLDPRRYSLDLGIWQEWSVCVEVLMAMWLRGEALGHTMSALSPDVLQLGKLNHIAVASLTLFWIYLTYFRSDFLTLYRLVNHSSGRSFRSHNVNTASGCVSQPCQWNWTLVHTLVTIAPCYTQIGNDTFIIGSISHKSF